MKSKRNVIGLYVFIINTLLLTGNAYGVEEKKNFIGFYVINTLLLTGNAYGVEEQRNLGGTENIEKRKKRTLLKSLLK